MSASKHESTVFTGQSARDVDIIGAKEWSENREKPCIWRSELYKRKVNQVSLFENPVMFGGIALNPENKWVKLAGIIPWWVFEKKYAEQFPSNKGQPACSLRQALGSQIIKEKYRFSDEMTVDHIAMNPYLQYFIGMTEYRQAAPFDPSMMSRFRQRLTTEMLQDVNDVIMGRKTAEQIAAEAEDHDEDHDDDSGEGSGGSGGEGSQAEVKDEPNKGTLILDATCAPQAIRFPTDTSLLNEARKNTEEIIDALHSAGLTDGKCKWPLSAASRVAIPGQSGP